MTAEDLEWTDDELMEYGRPGRRRTGVKQGLVPRSVEEKADNNRLGDLLKGKRGDGETQSGGKAKDNLVREKAQETIMKITMITKMGWGKRATSPFYK